MRIKTIRSSQRKPKKLKVSVFHLFLFIGSALIIYFFLFMNIILNNEIKLISPMKPPACTSNQRAAILEQLSPAKCNEKFKAYHQRCSLTNATKCPSQSWLNTYYQDLASPSTPSQFVAIYVGCNKGYDAVNALRMGTRDAKYNKNT